MKRQLTLIVMAGVFFAGAAAQAQPLLVPTDRNVGALALEYYRVEANVVDGVAGADVKMGFRNHTSRQLEATFIFPLPDGATVGEFRMEMGGKWVEGTVLEKNEAKRIYTDIVRRMKDPGLLELVGKNLFQARVFPVPANGVQRIEMRFATTLPQESGLYQLVYPLKTARNYAGTTKDFTFTMKLKSSTPLRSVYSPSHKVHVKRKGDDEAVVSFEKHGVVFNEDLRIFYSVDYNDVGLSVLSYRKKGEPGYFMILAAPGAKDTADEIPGKKIVFVVDTSGSMQGEKIERVRAAGESFEKGPALLFTLHRNLGEIYRSRLHEIDKVDIAIVAIGEDFETNVLTVALLKKLGVGHVIGRAGSAIQADILRHVGADRVTFPEDEIGERLADTLIATGIKEFINLGEDLSLVFIRAPGKIVGTAIKDLDLRARYGISIVALQKEVAKVSIFGKESIQSRSNRNPQPDDVIEAGSTLLIAGHPRDITKFAKEFGGGQTQT